MLRHDLRYACAEQPAAGSARAALQKFMSEAGPGAIGVDGTGLAVAGG
jgi:hypothetical protein